MDQPDKQRPDDLASPKNGVDRPAADDQRRGQSAAADTATDDGGPVTDPDRGAGDSTSAQRSGGQSQGGQGMGNESFEGSSLGGQAGSAWFPPDDDKDDAIDPTTGQREEPIAAPPRDGE